MRKNMKYILLLALIVLASLAAGCDKEQTASVAAQTTKQESVSAADEAKKQQPAEAELTLYYPDTNGEKLIAVKETKKIADGNKYLTAVKALLEKPENKNVVNVFPKNVKVRSVQLKGDCAYVDFSSEIMKQGEGSTGEMMIVGSVVNTLTEFPEVKKVQFLVEGEKVESFSGHMDTSEALARMKNLL